MESNTLKPVHHQQHNIYNYIYFNLWNVSSSDSSTSSQQKVNTWKRGHSSNLTINHHSTAVIEGNNNAGDNLINVTADTPHLSDIFPGDFSSKDMNSEQVGSYKGGLNRRKDIAFGIDNNSSITSTSAFNWDNNSDALDVTSILTNPTTTTSLDTVESFILTTMGYETKDMSLPTPTHDDSSNMNYTNLNIITNDHTHTTLLILISFVIIAVICNSFMCIVIKLDQRLHHMIYYFCSSMSLLHILIATTVMPLSAAVFVADEFIYNDAYCKLWVTMDLFLCNNNCLHIAFANMDTYLRLKDPIRHGRIITWCSLLMWTGAAWVISFVQGIAQFMLSQADTDIHNESICFIGDKNFLILGTLFAFIIPNIISIGFFGLCYREIRMIKLGRYFDENGTTRRQYNYGSDNSLSDDECSDASQESVKQENIRPSEIYPLSVVNETANYTMESNNRKTSNANNNALIHQQQHTLTSFNHDTSFSQENQLDDNIEVTTNAIQGHLNIAFSDDTQTGAGGSESCTLMLTNTNSTANNSTNHTPNTNHIMFNQQQQDNLSESIHECPDECLRHEIGLNKLMAAILVFTIILWTPLAVGNLILGLCTLCERQLTAHTMCILKWIAYSITIVAPVLYIQFSENVRAAGYKLFTCKYCQ